MAKPTRLTIDVETLRRLVRHLDDVAELIATEQANNGGHFTVYVENARDVDSDKDAKALKAFISREIMRARQVTDLLNAELGVALGQMKGSEDARKVEPDELA